MRLLNHPLADHYLCRLRDRSTPPAEFRHLCRGITTLLLMEAVRDLRLVNHPVQTPLEKTEGRRLAQNLVVVPILRAGLGMLEAITSMLPEVSVGHLGMERDETTAKANTYYRKLPPLKNSRVLLLDPMLATGGSAAAAMRIITDESPQCVSMLCVVAAPEGVATLEKKFPALEIHAAALDRCLDERKFILPGLGDFGDRLFGT